MHGPALRTALLGAALLVLVLHPGEVRAHKLDEVLVELTLGDDSWQAEARLDSRYVVATLMRHHLPPTPDLEWIHSRSPGEYLVMRDVTETFYREKFQFVMEGRISEVAIEFPDYATDPPRFTADEEGTPSVRVVLSGSYPAESGPMILKWNSDWGPTLVLLLKKVGEESQPAAVLVGLGEEVELGTRGDEDVEGAESSAGRSVGGGGLRSGFFWIFANGAAVVAFLVGCFLLVPERRTAVLQCACFLTAEGIMLVVVSQGLLAVPIGIIAALAALSLVYIGLENLFAEKLTSWRLGMVTGFGLVHGMFLAGAAEAPSPAGFFGGVALGQLAVIAVGGITISLFVRREKFRAVRILGSALIAFAGVYLVVAQLTS